jgi:hypothetical protein
MFLLPLLLAAGVPATPVDLHVILMPGESVAGRVKLDGREVCRLALEHDPERYIQPACRFDLPAGATLDFAGTSWKILDFGPVTAPFAQTGDFGERFATYAENLDAFGRKHLGEAWYGTWIEAGEPVSGTTLDAAEQRLGQPLPAEFRALLQRMGRVSVGDGYFSAAEGLDAYDYMIENWGTPRDSMKADLDRRVAQLLRATTVLYTEVGDGLGAVLYRAQAPDCDGGAAYWFVHQDTINEPELLRTGTGACANFAQVVHWLMDGEITNSLQDDLPENTLLIDPLSTHAALVLSLDPYEIDVRRVGASAQTLEAGATAAF